MLCQIFTIFTSQIYSTTNSVMNVGCVQEISVLVVYKLDSTKKNCMLVEDVQGMSVLKLVLPSLLFANT